MKCPLAVRDVARSVSPVRDVLRKIIFDTQHATATIKERHMGQTLAPLEVSRTRGCRRMFSASLMFQSVSPFFFLWTTAHVQSYWWATTLNGTCRGTGGQHGQVNPASWRHK